MARGATDLSLLLDVMRRPDRWTPRCLQACAAAAAACRLEGFRVLVVEGHPIMAADKRDIRGCIETLRQSCQGRREGQP